LPTPARPMNGRATSTKAGTGYPLGVGTRRPKQATKVAFVMLAEAFRPADGRYRVCPVIESR
jgi:hypothetical protein